MPDALLGGLGDQLLAMGETLIRMDVGVGLLIAVGISMSASHLFSLFANRLRPAQIAAHMVIDALGLSLAFLVAILLHCLMLTWLEAKDVQPIAYANEMGIALWPGLFYVLVGAPYISDLIAVLLLGWIHLNMLVLLQVRYGIPFENGLMVATPGFIVALVLIAFLFAQRWRSSYIQLSREISILS